MRASSGTAESARAAARRRDQPRRSSSGRPSNTASRTRSWYAPTRASAPQPNSRTSERTRSTSRASQAWSPRSTAADSTPSGIGSPATATQASTDRSPAPRAASRAAMAPDRPWASGGACASEARMKGLRPLWSTMAWMRAASVGPSTRRRASAAASSAGSGPSCRRVSEPRASARASSPSQARRKGETPSSTRAVPTNSTRSGSTGASSSSSSVADARSPHCRSSTDSTMGRSRPTATSSCRSVTAARRRTSSVSRGSAPSSAQFSAGTDPSTGNMRRSARSPRCGRSRNVRSGTSAQMRLRSSTRPSSALKARASCWKQRPVATHARPVARSSAQNRCTSTVLPMPLSPSTSTKAGPCSRTRSNASTSAARSATRPTNTVRCASRRASAGSPASAPSASSTAGPSGRSAGSGESSPTHSETSWTPTASCSWGSPMGPRVPEGSAPVSASWSTTPSAYQSDAGVAGSPISPSGAMYAGVPESVCSDGRRGRPSNSSARPKSSSRGRPSGSTSTLDGFRSRCSSPASCSACRPRAMPRNTSATARVSLAPMASTGPMPTTSIGSSRVCIVRRSGADTPRNRSGSAPSTSSIVKNQRSSSSPSSNNLTRLGWCSSAMARNSALNRSSDAASSSWRSFSATSRSRSSSRTA